MAEDNGHFKFLPLSGNLYVLLGIFHSFITKRLISGPSAGIDWLVSGGPGGSKCRLIF